ncbi:MAG: hypothetical protein ACXVBO_01410, partial [Isosphaeraceae bacterium]
VFGCFIIAMVEPGLVATGLTNLFSISRRIIGTQEEREHQPGWNGGCPCNWPPYSLNLAFDRQ